jgi:hypothetical protein
MKEIRINAAKAMGWASMSLIAASVRVLALTICRNVNIPWPNQGMGDGDYLYAFQEVIMPIAYEFEPDLVISQFPLNPLAGFLF